jgi:Fe-S-cluster containining protein
VKLHFPADQQFECTSCGRCCRASWTIAVDREAEPGIRASQAYQSRQRAGFQPLVTVEERLTTARSADRSCTFLDQQNLCSLHSELGGARKPLVCQTYPYLLMETPDGVFSTLSYACPVALEGQGPNLPEQRAELEALIAARWADMPQGPPVGETVQVSQRRACAWGQYLRLEDRILDSFDAEQPVLSLLGAAVHLILHEQDHSDQQWPDLAAPYNFGGFDRELATMVSCNLIAITEDVRAPEERARVGSLLWNGGRYQSARFELELPPFALRPPSTAASREVVARYVRHAIFGKRLLLGTVVSRLLAMVCGLSVLSFYLEALTPSWGEQAALDRAFTVVESELLSHTRSFDGFFLEFEEALRSVRDGLRGS